LGTDDLANAVIASGISDVLPSQAHRAQQYLRPRTGVKSGYAVDRALWLIPLDAEPQRRAEGPVERTTLAP